MEASSLIGHSQGSNFRAPGGGQMVTQGILRKNYFAMEWVSSMQAYPAHKMYEYVCDSW